MSTEPQKHTCPPGIDPVDFARWQENDERRRGISSARRADGIDTEELLRIARENLPEVAPPLPYAMTDEGKRMARFRQLCPPEFMTAIDMSQVKNPAAFNAARNWNGMFKGLLLTGTTGEGKTRAAWSALGRLFVKENRTFAWFPVKRLITEFDRYESKDAADEFWRHYLGFNALFVDDLDKINWQFESQCAAIFQFYDWVYRAHRPCVTTTNKGRAWWADKMGDAFARRLFEDAQTEVKF